MPFRPVHGKILDVLAAHPQGLCFNSLSQKLKGVISRVVLLKEVKRLEDAGVIVVERDPGHKQRKIFKLASSVRDLLLFLGEEIRSGERKACDIAVDLINRYASIKSGLRNEFLKEYLKYSVLTRIEVLMEEVA